MSRIRRAVVVAAGRSTRLQPLTLDTPKCLLPVDGEPMISRSLRILRAHEVAEIAVVVGFEHEQIRKTLGDGVDYLLNPFFAGTNNMASLWFAKDWVGAEPFLYLHGDIVYEPGLLKPLVQAPPEGSLLVDLGSVDEEAMKVRLDSKGRFVASSKEIPPAEAAGEWVGVAAFSAAAVPALFTRIEEVLAEGNLEAYDTEAFTRMASAGRCFEIVPTDGANWVEVDFEEDLEQARLLFSS